MNEEQHESLKILHHCLTPDLERTSFCYPEYFKTIFLQGLKNQELTALAFLTEYTVDYHQDKQFKAHVYHLFFPITERGLTTKINMFSLVL